MVIVPPYNVSYYVENDYIFNFNQNFVSVTTTSTEEKKSSNNTSTDIVKLAVKRPRPKAASPNRQGPQQCQVKCVFFWINK